MGNEPKKKIEKRRKEKLDGRAEMCWRETFLPLESEDLDLEEGGGKDERGVGK